MTASDLFQVAFHHEWSRDFSEFEFDEEVMCRSKDPFLGGDSRKVASKGKKIEKKTFNSFILTARSSPECCGRPDGALHLFHPDVKTCCANGTLASSPALC